MRGRQRFCIRLGRSCLIAELNQKKGSFSRPSCRLDFEGIQITLAEHVREEENPSSWEWDGRTSLH
jgi:hypothetical protein